VVVHSIKIPRFRAGVGVKGSQEVHAGGWCEEEGTRFRGITLSRNGLSVSEPRHEDYTTNPDNISSHLLFPKPSLPDSPR
jgi:hypothetical protein